VLRLDAGLGAAAEEALDTVVPEALDHGAFYRVSPRDTSWLRSRGLI
jgi:hypothetical protein